MPTGASPAPAWGSPIVKRIVERHGGEVFVTSRPGEGSTFGFRLPLETAPENTTRQDPPRSADPPGIARRPSALAVMSVPLGSLGPLGPFIPFALLVLKGRKDLKDQRDPKDGGVQRRKETATVVAKARGYCSPDCEADTDCDTDTDTDCDTDTDVDGDPSGVAAYSPFWSRTLASAQQDPRRGWKNRYLPSGDRAGQFSLAALLDSVPEVHGRGPGAAWSRRLRYRSPGRGRPAG